MQNDANMVHSHFGSSHFGSSIPSQEQPDQACARNLDTALHMIAQVSLQPRPFITFSLGQLERQSAKGEWLPDKAEAVVSLVKHTVQAARAGDIGVQQIANTAYGAARSSKGKHMGMLFLVLASAAAECCMRDSISQQLASAAWVFSRVCHQEEQLLFTALAAVAERRIRDFT